MFKVVPDQLRLSEGWVRCGHCSEIFDAAAHLQPLQPEAPSVPAGEEAPALAPPVEPKLEPVLQTELPAAIASIAAPAPDARLSAWAPDSPLVHFLRRPSAPPEAAAVASDAGGAVGAGAAEAIDTAESAPVVLDASDAQPRAVGLTEHAVAEDDAEFEGYDLPSALLREMPVAEGLDDQVFAAAFPVFDAEADRASPHLGGAASGPVPDAVAAVFDAPVRGAAGSDREDGDDDLLTPEMSFVRAARRRAFWRRPVVRGVLLVLVAAFGLALLAQVGLHQRDSIAAHAPWTRPLLQLLCTPPSCTVAAPRQIESVVIDSSSFNSVRAGEYQLGLTLRSHASTALAMPALELSLTDSRGQLVVRKVLLPADLGAPPVLAAHGEWSSSLPVALAAVQGVAPRVAGYSLLAFYP